LTDLPVDFKITNENRKILIKIYVNGNIQDDSEISLEKNVEYP
jgi:hypothetical protein